MIAQRINVVEPETRRGAWKDRFRCLLSDRCFGPGGRILATAETDRQITFYNCYKIPSPHDSCKDICTTLSCIMEAVVRSSDAGINISSLRLRRAYTRRVNGRSSGAVPWSAIKRSDSDELEPVAKRPSENHSKRSLVTDFLPGRDEPIFILTEDYQPCTNCGDSEC